MLATATMLTAVPAQAQTTMTFDANACDGPYAGGPGGATYIEGGFQLEFYNYSEPDEPGQHGGWCTPNENYAGSAAMWGGNVSERITLTAVGGGTFSLNSIDLARMFFAGDSGRVVFIGNTLGGGVLNRWGYTSGSAASTPVFSTTYFDASWTDLTAVSWNQSNGPHQFDNIVLNGAPADGDVVPEPATMTLLATGLAGLAGMRKRRAA